LRLRQTPKPPTHEQADGIVAAETNRTGATDDETVQEAADGKDLQSGILEFDGRFAYVVEDDDASLLKDDFTIFARILTDGEGTIAARAPVRGEWSPGGRTLFVREGRLTFDIGWVGAVESEIDVADGEWHDVAATYRQETGLARLYVDGELAAEDSLEAASGADGHVAKIGFTAVDFPEGRSAFSGEMKDLAIYDRALDEREIAELSDARDVDEIPAAGLSGFWTRLAEEGRLFDESGARRSALRTVAGRRDRDEDETDVEGPSGGAATSTLCGVVGTTPECKWLATDGGEARLLIPRGAEPLRLAVLYGSSDDADDLQPLRAALDQAEPAEDLAPLCQGGPRRWTAEAVTSARKMDEGDGPFAAEAISLPNDNPYRSWMRLGGFDFFDDGDSAAVCTWQGDVWLVSGLTSSEGEFHWRRIASGMFQPLGLKIVDGVVYVTCRDQITILRDLND
ncbi:MAG: LamG domain-containing protein, partial [Planctomycetota bacterium]